MKVRLDTLLVEKGLCADLKTAGGYVLAGKVLVNDLTVTKPGTQVEPTDNIRIKALPQFVSRAGNKLSAAIEYFKPPLRNTICIDAGASTGGFTDALLQAGAGQVIAVDVAYGFLHPRLRADKRVIVLERKNICELRIEDLPVTPEFFTADVSFTSLRNILPCILKLMSSGRPYSGIVLFKPQFEVTKDELSLLDKGVLHDQQVTDRYLHDFTAYCYSLNLTVAGTFMSPVKGRRGNQEILVYLKSAP